MTNQLTPEHKRLQAANNGGAPWKQWGPYMAERAWGTVREDYSASGGAWDYFPHDQARARAYRYPQRAFPYAELVAENARRDKDAPEYELLDTGVFADDRYFDVLIEYAKAAPDDILVRISATNHGPETAPLHLLPTLWFRNTWSWGNDHPDTPRPSLRNASNGDARVSAVCIEHAALGRYLLVCDAAPALLFTENETNVARLYGVPNPTPYVKDGINEAVVHGRAEAVNPAGTGTKAAAHYQRVLAPGETVVVTLRLSALPELAEAGDDLRAELELRHARLVHPFEGCDAVFAARRAEADAFYAATQPPALGEDARMVQRQAFAGMLWSKQFYSYDVDAWLRGDPAQPAPPPERTTGRNNEWRHLNTADILSMPDTWEYPWFAAWDVAFHCIPLALLDAEFAKAQLLLLHREWYQHPNGQIPAYEWAFGDVNPPVLAWAAWRVYKIDQKARGVGDTAFLERVFHKLLLNFTWWVNRKDAEGKNVFQGGFLGLDNIGVFDRSSPLPTGGHIEQADGTSWMGMFCLNMLSIALELACTNSVYEDIATKFFEHFLYIAEAMNNIGGDGIALWDEEDAFFYDVLHLPDDTHYTLKVRSLVGLIPLFAVTTIEPALLEQVPAFRQRLEWFLKHRPHLAQLISRWHEPGAGERRLIALCRGHRMKRVLRRMLDEAEFLSEHGVRSLSRVHAEQPYTLAVDGTRYTVAYQPGESNSGLFGGNSNWRGPVWFPVNYLLIEALQQFHHYYGDDFLVEYPTGSGTYYILQHIADDLSQRLISIFTRDAHGRRAVFGDVELFQRDEHWRDYLPFYEYFHGDTGVGVGASHQTGWTGLVAKLIQQQGARASRNAEAI